MNCVLIGYRGTGKSTVGALVAAELDLPLVSLDEEIVKRAGLSIPEIVEQHSWKHFRDLEPEVVRAHAARDAQVLDTGGGVVTRQENIDALRAGGVIFLLEAEIDDIVQRIGGGTDRPSLTGDKSFVEEVAEVLAERLPLYRKAADHTINTSELSPPGAAREITGIFRKAGPRAAS